MVWVVSTEVSWLPNSSSSFRNFSTRAAYIIGHERDSVIPFFFFSSLLISHGYMQVPVDSSTFRASIKASRRVHRYQDKNLRYLDLRKTLVLPHLSGRLENLAKSSRRKKKKGRKRNPGNRADHVCRSISAIHGIKDQRSLSSEASESYNRSHSQ